MHEHTVAKLRAFNRFYLSVMDFYENTYHYQDKSYSITEARVLYELYECKSCSADQIVRQLHLDKGYLSRIIKGFEARGLLTRQKSAADARSYQIHLTDKGRLLTEALNRESDRGIDAVIQNLSTDECAQLEAAIDTVKQLLTKEDTPNENHTV